MANPKLDKVLAQLDAGQHAEAARQLKLLALKNPGDVEILYLSGVAESGLGDEIRAGACFDRVLARQPAHEGALYGKTRLLGQAGRHADALAVVDRALALTRVRDNPWLYLIRGNARAALADYAAAIDDYDRALSLKGDLVEAHSNRGNALVSLGRAAEALDGYRQALALRPGYAGAWFNQGVAHAGLGRLEEAVASYRRALELAPDVFDAWLQCGLALSSLQRTAEAIVCFERLLFLQPGHAQAQRLFAEHIADIEIAEDAPNLAALLTRALDEAWTHPARLARVAGQLLQASPAFRACSGPVPAYGLLGESALLQALLGSTPVCDETLEQFLAQARAGLLHRTSITVAEQAFFSALAQQCFINEYVFADDETGLAETRRQALADALAQGAQIPVLLLLAVACHFPLAAIEGCEQLLQRDWPHGLAPLLACQIAEPLEEQARQLALPQLTPIDDAISVEVRSQYEAHPYPRWMRVPRETPAASVEACLRSLFPQAPLVPVHGGSSPDILIAGCGTGRHPAWTAQVFPQARVLAIDLSGASLAYAQRKTEEMGLRTIDYGQADILHLDGLGKTFDVVESIGVLHHLEQPLEGWRRLAALVRPGGFMHLGFYSESARRAVVRARERIAQWEERGEPGGSAGAIRRARALLRAQNPQGEFDAVLRSHDFYSLSDCRDLLFHVQEHRLTLAQIERFLAEQGLVFLGFTLPAVFLHAYRARFPDDPAAIHLPHWQAFESEHPDTFAGMYQFWVQKRGADAAP